MADTYDVIVIGAGPGGYVAAIRSSQLGLKTAIVEREHLGGICLNWGCIPTKALLRSADVWHTLQHLKDYGFAADNPRFDIEAIVKRSRGVASQLSNGVKFLMKKNKIPVIDGTATLQGKGVVAVKANDGRTTDYTATNIILATGARARQLPGLEADGKLVWSYKEAMVPPAMPKSLLVIGSGAIGIEFASFYRTLGAEVTVVEVMERVLPVEDEEIAAFAAKQFKKQGMTLITGASVTKLDKGKDSVTCTVKTKDGKEQQITVDRVISAVGIVGNTENLGLEALGVKIEKTHVVVDKWGATSVPGLWAIGDLAGAPWLAHKASHEGIIVAERIAGVKGVHPLDVSKIPGCTYCTPQVASVGLTEAAARAKGYEVKVGRFPFIGNGKAIALGDTDGMAKTVFDAKTGELLGAHMVGPEVTELIQGYTIARTLEATEADLMTSIFPHPTLSEVMGEAVLDAYRRVIHV